MKKPSFSWSFEPNLLVFWLVLLPIQAVIEFLFPPKDEVPREPEKPV